MKKCREFTKAILSLSCALSVIAVTGCKREIKGQVFIVTQGADNIKLGAIEILLIDKNQVTEFLKLKSSAVEAEILAVERVLLTDSNQLQIAESELDGFKSTKPVNPQGDYDEYYDEYFSNPFFKNYPDLDGIKKRVAALLQQSKYLVARGDALKQQANTLAFAASNPYSDQSTAISLQGYAKKAAANAEVKKLEDYVEATEKKLESDFNTAREKLAFTKSYLRSIPRVESYLSDFSPTYVQKTMTDADGRFSFSYSKDKTLTIYAVAQRKVLNETEHYTWLVDVPKAGDAKFYLSNNKLATVDPNGYFAVKPKR